VLIVLDSDRTHVDMTVLEVAKLGGIVTSLLPHASTTVRPLGYSLWTLRVRN
jgi:hypothetical protein